MAKLGHYLATLEDASNAEELANAEEGVEAQETATEVVEAAAEVTGDVDAIEQTDAAIDDAFEAGDQIDELTTVAEDSLAADGETVEEGEVGVEGEGLTEGEATMIEITHESIMRSLGMPIDSRRATFTAESFGNKANRRQLTMEALDGLKQSAKNVGAGIIAALKAAWNSVSNFIAGLLRNAGLMEKHLINLDAKVKNLDASLKPRADKFKTAAGALSVNGVASPATAHQILKSAAGAVTAAAAIGDALGRMKNSNVEAALTDAKGEVKGAIEKIGDKAAADGKEAYGHFSGGRSVVVDENGSVSITEGGKKAEEIAAPSREDMASLIREARAVCVKLKEVQKNSSKFKSLVDYLTARLSELGSNVKAKVGTEGTKIAGTMDSAVKQAARLSKSLMSKAGGQLPGLAFQSVKAVADYVTAGLNNYKPEAAAKAPEGQAAAAAA